MRDSYIGVTTLRRFSYMGSLKETINMFGKASMVEGLIPGDIVIINAFHSPLWYEVTPEMDLTEYLDDKE